jgi:hypothetical protein
MPLILLLLALFVPRVVIFLLWLFTSWFSGVFPNGLIGVLGFLILPYVTLWYSAVHHWFGGEWGPLQIIILIIALLFDIGPAGGSRWKQSQ